MFVDTRQCHTSDRQYFKMCLEHTIGEVPFPNNLQNLIRFPLDWLYKPFYT